MSAYVYEVIDGLFENADDSEALYETILDALEAYRPDDQPEEAS